ncbi:MAG: AbgT family transporter [Candidatus Howiella sp.]|jgi:aminobenzoyl-glutamate transport protein
MHQKKKTSMFTRALGAVERLGNRLPHPVTLFAILTLGIVLLSWICAVCGVSAAGEMIDPATLEVGSQTVSAVSLLSREGISYMLTHLISNFTSFAPLGVVLVTMLGTGCAEGSGYLSALLRRLAGVTPRALVTPVLVFLGVMSNVATDVGYVVLIPLGALLFMAYGRHPLAGLAAAFAGVSGGFSANLVIGALDPLLAGISTEAAGLVDPGTVVQVTDNWYFMIVSTFLIVWIGTLVTDRIVEPRLGAYTAASAEEDSLTGLSDRERKGMRTANLVLLLLAAALVIAALPQNSPLRNPETGSLTTGAPLMDGLIVLIALLFFVPSVIYGRMTGVYKGERDICRQLEKNMSSMGSYIALIFVAAQFVGFFGYSKLGTILALKGAALLKASGIGGPVLMVLFILLTAAVNLVMGSATAKWTVLAPVFVPMFMMLGYSPALTQVAYRIGDSCTNLITPLMSYFAMIVVFAKRYDAKAGIGTLISMMLPYSLFFLIGWSLLLVVWMVLGLPLGPGAGLTMG